MTAQEFLSQIGTLQKRIETNIRRVEQMQELLTKITPSISDMPKSSTPNVHAFEDRICAKVALEKEIEQDTIQLEKVKLDIVDVIMQVQNDECRELLYKRYVDLLPWNAIVAKLGYTDKYVFALHRKVLKQISIPDGYKNHTC